MTVTTRRSASYLIFLSALTLLGSVWLQHPQFFKLIHSHIIGGAQGDGGLYVWLASSFHVEPTKALAFESNAFYPYPVSRAWSDSFLLPSALIHVLLSAGLSLELSYNMTVILAMVANGLGLIALCRTLSLAWFPSIAAALVFTNCSYLVGNLGHPQLIYLFWVPLSWALALSNRTSPFRWFVAGLCVSCAFYCSVYYAVFAASGLAIAGILQVGLRRCSVKQGFLRGLATSLGALPIAYALPAYLAVKDTFGTRGLYEANAFSASGLSYLAFSSFHPIFGATSQWTHSEATLSIGYATLCLVCIGALIALRGQSRALASGLRLSILALGLASTQVDSSSMSEWVVNIAAWSVLILALRLTVRNKTIPSIFFAIVATFFVLSFGPGGNPNKHEPAFAPFSLFYAAVPGFDAIRAVSRCGAIFILGAFTTLAWVFTQISKSGWPAPRITIAAITAIALFENYIPAPPLDPVQPPPLILETLASRITPTEAVVFIPSTVWDTKASHPAPSWSQFATLNTRYALWTAPLKINTVNGYSGQRSKIINDILINLDHIPTTSSQQGIHPQVSVDQVRRICGARWIVVMPSHKELLQSPLPPGLSLVASASDGSALLSVNSEVPISSNTLVTFFAPHSETLSIENGAPSCAISISSLEKTKGGSVASRLLEPTPLSNNGLKTLLGDPTPHSHKPLVLEVRTAACQTIVHCQP